MHDLVHDLAPWAWARLVCDDVLDHLLDVMDDLLGLVKRALGHGLWARSPARACRVGVGVGVGSTSESATSSRGRRWGHDGCDLQDHVVGVAGIGRCLSRSAIESALIETLSVPDGDELAGQVEFDRVGVDPGQAGGMHGRSRVDGRPGQDQVGRRDVGGIDISREGRR